MNDEWEMFKIQTSLENRKSSLPYYAEIFQQQISMNIKLRKCLPFKTKHFKWYQNNTNWVFLWFSHSAVHADIAFKIIQITPDDEFGLNDNG